MTKGNHRIDLTPGQALLTHGWRPGDLDRLILYVGPRNEPTFAYMLTASEGRVCEFWCRNELQATGLVGEVRKPHDEEDDSDYWRLLIESDTWHRVRPRNISLSTHRLDPAWITSAAEIALAEAWARENEEIPGLHGGRGLLQALICSSAEVHGLPEDFGHPLLTQRDRYIAAEVIQWLGTNGGIYFLDRLGLKKHLP